MLYKLPRVSIGFRFAASMPLLMIKGIGWQLNTSHQYVWNGRKRTDEHFLFQYTLKGHGVIEIGRTNYSLKEGDAFIVEVPGDHCYSLPTDSSQWEVLYIEFSKEALPFWHQLLTLTAPVFSMKADSEFIKSVWNTYEMAVKDQFYDVYQNSKYAYKLIMELTSNFFQIRKTKLLPSKIELCKQYIDMHYAENIGLDNMAEAAGISKFYLTRQFEKEVGLTPGNYLTKVRLENSVKLLVFSNDMNLDEIAKQSGFSSANYFGKVFKKHMGVTTAEFRKTNNSYEINRILSQK